MKCIFVCACLAHEILDNKLKILEQLEQAAQCPIEGGGVEAYCLAGLNKRLPFVYHKFVNRRCRV